ncbi:MAG: NAD-dependent epimerase/dehydratase family protein [Chitinophagaceae bacterium]
MSANQPRILLTGAAGFVGMHTTQRLLDQGFQVVGLDNLNAYYAVSLKHGRLGELGIDTTQLEYGKALTGKTGFTFIQGDLADETLLRRLFTEYPFDAVINLAAQAGVRYSITNPQSYIQSNVVGFFNILEMCRHFKVHRLLYASSSSVYGNNKDIPFKTTDRTDEPVSLYAATKKSNELMAYTYAHLYGLHCTGMRFFTVYGPWGRPDMAYFSFSEKIAKGEPIGLFNDGQLKRDFTYIDDIVESIFRLLQLSLKENENNASYSRILNLGNQHPVWVRDFVAMLEKHLGQQAIIESKPMQAEDVYITYAHTRETEELTGFTPNTPLEEGLKHFIEWFRQYSH